MVRHGCKSLLSALLVVSAGLVALAGTPRAQEGPGASARILDRPAAAMAAAQRQRARQARHHRRLQRQRIEQAAAHARMPSTMYASTPDPTTPSHPFPLDVGTQRAAERTATPARVSARATVRRGHRIGLFPAAGRWEERGYQGFARLINRSGTDGEVHIDAFDDAGIHAGRVTLTIGAGEALHFNSEDLERGNACKGLSSGVGAPSAGDWRLDLTSALDLEVLAYIRTEDGFLTGMHDRVPRTEAGHRVVIFNPGRNANQASRLRLVNPGAEAADVRIEGSDDRGESSDGAVTLSVAAGASRTLTAPQLESGEGEGLSGALGTGTGKWQLVVSSDRPIEVMSVLRSSETGHLTNLSTVPDNIEPGADGATTVHTVALFPGASDPQGRQGFVRVINRSAQGGEASIEAFDDAGMRRGPVVLDLDAHETVHFNSGDLEGGNSGKGLSGHTGAGTGDWRLRLGSSLDLQVLAYIRTGDGFLTSVHDVVPVSGSEHRVAIFNPGRNTDQASRLRLINPGEEAVEVTIEGIDGKGGSSDGAVVLSVPARASRTLTAQQLESGGKGLTGALGTGAGKWRLTVTADRPIEVMSLLSSPTGHLTNLSTIPGKVELEAGEMAAEVFAEHISGPIVQKKCVNCHVEGGIAGATRLHFVPSSTPDHETLNLRTFETFLAAVDGGAALVLNKIQGVAHGGGVQVAAGTEDFANMERFLGLLGEEVSSAPLTPQTLFDTVRMASLRKTLRRAALIFAGRNPTDAEYSGAQGGAASARAAIRGLMTGPEFHEFLVRGANDRLLTDRDDGDVIARHARHFVEYTNEAYRRLKVARESGDESKYWEWKAKVQHGARRAPVELIAHVVENDRPYTEILTADYIMANPWAAAAYGASTRFDDPGDVHEFKPSQIESYYRVGEGFEEEDHPVLGPRVVDPGPLSTDWPHAGVLNTMSFLRRYPTTATNRNRARSRWTYYHFLGLDVEKSASRTADPDALADTNNPTMLNPACTVCHRVLDPVAGAFQNYADEGYYKNKWGGLDSLDDYYKKYETPNALPIQATSWEDRETLSWSTGLAAGVQTLRVLYTNHFWDEEAREGGAVYLDRLRITDVRGRVLVSREFEDLEAPVTPWGRCGEAQYNPSSGRTDHLILWGGYLECAFFIDVEVPDNGTYDIEIVAWSIGQDERYEGDGFAGLAVAANAYQEGDTWYRDMRTPGFAGEQAPNSDNSAQWLAQQIVADERFAEAAVKFWWPAIMGSEVAEPPEDEGDADFEGLLLAANAQSAEGMRLANGFRRGFRGRAAYNLKDLLVEMVLSKWFRADAVEDDHPVRSVALRDAGARRLLTPEELDRKTAAITGLRWGWWPRISQAYRGPESRLTDAYRLLYGGIDSDGVAERARDLTSVMAGVARRHAVQVSCQVVMRELYLIPEGERRLFAGIDRHVTPGLELGALFEIEAGSRAERETLSMTGPVTAGSNTVRMAFTNDYWDESTRTGPTRPSRPSGRAQLRRPSCREPRAGGAAVAGGLQKLERRQLRAVVSELGGGPDRHPYRGRAHRGGRGLGGSGRGRASSAERCGRIGCGRLHRGERHSEQARRAVRRVARGAGHAQLPGRGSGVPALRRGDGAGARIG